MRILFAIYLLGAAAHAETVEKRVYISGGRPSGTLVATQLADGTRHIVYDVLDNGRGPHVDMTLKLAPDGTPAAFTAKGHHEMGAAIDETFTSDGKRARWKSAEESGERQVIGPTFFVPIAPNPEIFGRLVQALMKSNGKITLLPDGEARGEKVAETTERHKKLNLWVIRGVTLDPTYVWMNDDGSWFGNVSVWAAVVPEGWNDVVDRLVKIQDDVTRTSDAALAKSAAHHPPKAGLAYTNARVLDVEHGRWLSGQTVLVEGDTIKQVGDKVALPKGVEVVDLAGKAILPGLWDMHAHLDGSDGVMNIASGVTTVRDVGNDPDKLDDYKKRFEDGSAIGPRVYRMGFIEGRGPKAAGNKITAETESEAKAAVEFYAKRGYDGIKIYNSIKTELVPILAREAHARGMQVTGHIPVHMLANEAVRAGYDGIEHVNMLFLNFFATHETDTRDTTRFTLVGDKAATFDLHSVAVDDFLKLLVEHHTVVDPTVNTFEDVLVAQQGKITPGIEQFVARLPVQTQRTYLMGGLPLGDKTELYRRSYDRMIEMVKRLADAKVTVVVGTDSQAGFFMDHELALMVRGKIAPADALRMATLDAARVLHADGKSGSIAPGKLADLFVVDGDPLARIRDLEHVRQTMKGGVVYDANQLHQAVGVR